MHRLAVILFGLAAFELSASVSEAKIKSFQELSATQIMALQESENRLATFDRDLQDLEREREYKEISLREFAWQRRDLVAYIGAEAQFQNSILTHETTFPEGPELSDQAVAVLRTVGKYSIEVPGYVLDVALEGLGRSGFTFSP
jgi:hypothetical protein